MFSFKLYHSFSKPNYNVLRCYKFWTGKQFLKDSPIISKFSKSLNSSNATKLAMYGLGGTIVTYISCAIWEYETVRGNMTRRSSLKNLFTNIVGRQPLSSDIFYVIAGINLVIFSMFSYTTQYSHILKKFLLHPKSPPIALFSSMFTHLQFFHLLVNMYVLYSFTPLINYFGSQHFTAIYITGGLVSGMASVIYKTMKSVKAPSIGASGAILTILGMFAAMNPDLRFGIPIVSDVLNFNFSAQTAVGLLLTMDVCGLVFFKASRFDHVCHISAVLFGVFYGLVGRKMFWESRKTWMSWYYRLRSKF